MATTSATSTVNSTLDVASVVSQLMTVEQRPLTLLATKETSYQAKLSAFGSVQGALGSFQTAVSGLTDLSRFQSLNATVSDTSIASATASSSAIAGTYSLAVTKLAQSQQLVANGQASSTSAIGSGTLTFDFGTISGTQVNGKYTAGATFTSNGNGAKTVTIDASNNSLQGIRDAINSAGIGITATIVNDGGASPYRLALTSNNIGANNSIKIFVAEDPLAPGLAAVLAHDPAGTQNLTETAAAQNAEFNVNGIAISKASNTVTDVIQGVTLNLTNKTTSPVNVTVTRNTSTISTAVSSFVKAYNDLNSTLVNVSSYNAATKTGAVLLGDSTIRSLQTQLRGILNKPIGSTGGTLTTLSQIGVSFQKDGTLALDSTKLTAAINSNFNDIASLFATVGKSSDSLVGYSSATADTKPGSYAVNVSALATQGSTTGNVNLNSASTTIASGTTINTTVDGVNATVALTAGTYTATQLAAMIQSAINGTAAFSSAGSSVAATIDGSGFLNITSKRYGSASNVSLANDLGTPVTNFMGSISYTSGTDVAGTIDGFPATGSGQNLTANSGGATGLKIQINGGALGARGMLNYSQGYAYTLNNFATAVLANDGMLTGRTNGLNKSIADIGKQRDALNKRLASIQANYTAQFTALNVMLSNLNQTQNFLTSQLAKL
ncbi:MAG: flagellar filament capping protein FliD [Nitrosomonadales bacterium]|nr:flagellar filament capping protein FliD [Nitrosomonadales bacterium]